MATLNPDPPSDPSALPPTAEGAADILATANSTVIWLCAFGVFAAIFVQSLIYMRAARAAGPEVGVSRADLNSAFRAGAVASIGPSLAVVLVAVALLALFGTPAVLVRIGLIGSAATETASAGIAAGTAGAELGGSGYDASVFALAFIAALGVMVIMMVVTARGYSEAARTMPLVVGIPTIVFGYFALTFFTPEILRGLFGNGVGIFNALSAGIIIGSVFASGVGLKFTQSVIDLSLNVMANLGWDEVRLPNPVFEGDTIYSRSEVLEKRESKSRPNVGIVRVKTTGFNQDGTIVIEFLRTFMVYKRGHVPPSARVRIPEPKAKPAT